MNVQEITGIVIGLAGGGMLLGLVYLRRVLVELRHANWLLEQTLGYVRDIDRKGRVK